MGSPGFWQDVLNTYLKPHNASAAQNNPREANARRLLNWICQVLRRLDLGWVEVLNLEVQVQPTFFLIPAASRSMAFSPRRFPDRRALISDRD